MTRLGEAFVAGNATVLGEVTLGRDANVWYGAVIRGDEAPLTVGARTNIQDGVVMHADTDLRNDVGEEVTVGHGVTLHGSRVERWCLIGMGATLLARSVIGEGSIVAAGCVVGERVEVPPYSLVAGVPGKVIRTLDPGPRRAQALEHAAHYIEQARAHLAGRWGKPGA
jgi:carbonic anhydrase/acetyltransferase-like protein (isoleucine patch superfamily)